MIQPNDLSVPQPYTPTAIDQARINAYGKKIHNECKLPGSGHSLLIVRQAYSQLLNHAVFFYYQFSIELKEPHIPKLYRVRIIQAVEGSSPAQIECGWGDFKKDDPAPTSNEDNLSMPGGIFPKIPDATDYARVNAWKGVIVEKCGIPQYKDCNFYIIQAYYQVVSGTKYYYEIYPQGILCGKPTKCTIFQPLGHQSGIPSNVECGWGGFKGTSTSGQNSKNQGKCLPGRTVQEADKVLVALNKEMILHKCNEHLAPWTHLDILQVKEQAFTEGEYATKLYYELYPHGLSCGQSIYTTIFVSLYPTVKYTVTCGWDGDCK